jgi:hypothetical protein
MSYLNGNIRALTFRLGLRGGFDAAELSGDLTLTLKSSQIQILDPGGSARNVTLPAVDEKDRGYWFLLYNAADASEAITVKNASAVTVATVQQDCYALVYVNDSNAWALAFVAGQSHFDFAAGAIQATQPVTFPQVTTVDMADAAHALVLGTAGAAQTKLLGNIVFCDPNSGGASEILTLPPEASSTGLVIYLFNTGGEGIVVNDDAAATVVTLDTAQHALLACDGTTWRGFIGGVT